MTHPALIKDITFAVRLGSRRGYPNTGQVAVLNAVALIQIQHASEGVAWGASRSEVIGLTGFSESTVRRGIKHFLDHGVLRESSASIQTTYILNLEV